MRGGRPDGARTDHDEELGFILFYSECNVNILQGFKEGGDRIFYNALPWLLRGDRTSWVSLGAGSTASRQDPQHVEKSRGAEAC